MSSDTMKKKLYSQQKVIKGKLGHNFTYAPLMVKEVDKTTLPFHSPRIFYADFQGIRAF